MALTLWDDLVAELRAAGVIAELRAEVGQLKAVGKFVELLDATITRTG